MQACASLRQQLSAAQQKATRLTAARDKLELILHDLEAASAEEQQQLEHQLAAANKALGATGQQLAAVQQELTRTQAELSDTQQQRDAAAQQLTLLQQQQHEADLQQQSAQAAAAELQEQGRNAAAAAAAAAHASTVDPKVDTAAQVSAAQVGTRHDWLQAQGCEGA
jgi:chromosome segregation ATPase